MASGSVYGSTSNDYISARLDFVSTPSVETNTSKVVVTLYLKKTSSTATTGNFSGQIYIAGTLYNISNRISVSSSTGWVKVGSATKASVAHESDGSKMIRIYATGGISGTTLSSLDVDGSVKLDTIPRSSTVTAQSGTLGQPIVISVVRQSTAFTHTLKYSFAGNTGTIASNSTDASFAWTPSLDFASDIPNASNATCTITCETYNGSTLVGTTTTTCTLSVPSDAAPTMPVEAAVVVGASDNATVNSWATTDDFFLQSYSYASVTVDRTKATAMYGATIARYQVLLDGTLVAGDAFTSDTVTATSAVIGAAGNHTVTVTLYDSRGKTASQSYGIVVLPYSMPTVTDVQAFRCDQNGAEADEGTYIALTAQAAFASVGGLNGISMTAAYKPAASTAYTTTSITPNAQAVLGGGGINISSAYDVRVTVRDTLGNASTYDAKVMSADVALHIRKGGTAAALFEYAQPDQQDESLRVKHIITDSVTVGGKVVLPVDDTGWLSAESLMTDAFTAYGTAFPTYRRVGHLAMVTGTVKPTTAIASSTERQTILTLPEGFRPAFETVFLCQGSGNAVWECCVQTNGNVCFARYRNHTVTGISEFVTATTSAWLPFSAVYFVD